MQNSSYKHIEQNIYKLEDAYIDYMLELSEESGNTCQYYFLTLSCILIGKMQVNKLNPP